MTPNSPGRNPERRDRLAILYQAFLTATVRVQSGRTKVHDAESFRRQMKGWLQDAERNARALKYDHQDIQDGNLAVVAFLDEVILACDDHVRSEWMRLPLAQEVLGQSAAGEVFFERLEGLLTTSRDSPGLADVIDVYLLCLVLGFQGKHAREPGELHAIAERTRVRIEGIRDDRDKALAPRGDLPEESIAEVAVPESARPMETLTKAAVGTLGAAILAFLLFWLVLDSAVERVIAGN